MAYTTKKITLIFLSYIITLNAFAQLPGKIIEQQNISSNILGKNVKYSIYLPPNYETSKEVYPVIYLLHGYGGNNNAWIKSGNINQYADKAIGNNTIPPIIIVMPNGDSSWYINSYDNKVKYEDFFVNEFMPAIEKMYRIKSEKKIQSYCRIIYGWIWGIIVCFKTS